MRVSLKRKIDVKKEKLQKIEVIRFQSKMRITLFVIDEYILITRSKRDSKPI